MKIHLSRCGIKINACQNSFYAVLLVFSMLYFGEIITKRDHMSCHEDCFAGQFLS